jgi:TonB-dependent starch-binding outer membrane protein SusC
MVTQQIRIQWASLVAALALPVSLGAQTTVHDSARVTAADSQPRRSGTRVSGADLDAAPVFTLEQALQGKLAGLIVDMNDGAPWSDGQLRIRGISTLVGDPSPLVVLDGVLITNTLFADAPRGRQPARSSARLRDLTAFEIERVEVVKGPLATARFGARGAGGVLVITTRRVREAGLRWRATQRTGQVSGVRLTAPRCQTSLAAAKADFPVYAPLVDAVAAAHGGTLPCYGHDREFFGNDGVGVQGGVEASGQVGASRALASASQLTVGGPVSGSGVTRSNLRLNLEQQFGTRFEARLATGLSNTRTRKGAGTNDARLRIAGVPSWLALVNGPVNLELPYAITSVTERESDRRITTALLLRYLAQRTDAREVSIELHSGVDQLAMRRTSSFLPDAVTGASSEDVTSELSRLDNHAFSVAVTQRLSSGDRVALRGAATLDRQSFDWKVRSATNGVPEFQGTTTANGRANALAIEATGSFIDDRLGLTTVLRHDNVSTPISRSGASYPAIGAEYRLVTRPSGASLVVRGAWGRSGGYGAPGSAPFANYFPRGTPAYSATTPSSPPLERRTESEAGLDASSGGSRVALSVSAFAARIDGLLGPVSFPTVNGFAQGYMEIEGALRLRGAEVTLTTVNLARGPFRWESTFTVSRAASRIAGQVASAELPGTEYYPDRAHFTLPDMPAAVITHSRAIGDGAAALDASLRNQLRLGPLSLMAQLDARAGGDIHNSALARQDRRKTSADFDAISPRPATRLGDFRVSNGFGADSAGTYISSASALRVREVVLRYELTPRRAHRAFGSKSFGVSVQARNLALWSRAPVADPEFSALGTSTVARYVSDAAYPLMRQVYLGLDASF